MSGAGNTFTVIDNRTTRFTIEQLKELSINLCKGQHQMNQKTEGFIAIEQSDFLDFKIHFFNPDGSYGAMCGNGGRCAVRFAEFLNLINDSGRIIKFEMANSIYEAEILADGNFSIRFNPPSSVVLDKQIHIGEKLLNLDYVDVGSDHAVLDFDELKIKEDFRTFGLDAISIPIRFAEEFSPRGVNVNIYKLTDGVIHLRTYERGVEAETGACGTGSISTALIVNIKHSIQSPVTVIPPSRIPIFVDLQNDSDGKINSVLLTGPATFLDQKEIELPNHLS
jgi:diaminopimelate epimerase